jgi:hypothetical protein
MLIFAHLPQLLIPGLRYTRRRRAAGGQSGRRRFLTALLTLPYAFHSRKYTCNGQTKYCSI